MKKNYIKPEVLNIPFASELMVVEQSLKMETDLTDGEHVGSGSDIGDGENIGAGAKKGFWDDDYED